jgi:hypothetical protein
MLDTDHDLIRAVKTTMAFCLQGPVALAKESEIRYGEERCSGAEKKRPWCRHEKSWRMGSLELLG